MSAEPAGEQHFTADTLEPSFKLRTWGLRWYLVLSPGRSVTPLNGRTGTWTQDLKPQIPSLFSPLPASGGDSGPSPKDLSERSQHPTHLRGSDTGTDPRLEG